MGATQSSTKPLQVLVGDDQIGVAGSIQQRGFLRNYATIDARFDFTTDEHDFVAKACAGKYDALLIDLNWTPEDESLGPYGQKTGYRVLSAVRDYAPVRLMHTSDDVCRAEGMRYGATRCIEKNRGPTYMAHALNGGEL